MVSNALLWFKTYTINQDGETVHAGYVCADSFEHVYVCHTFYGEVGLSLLKYRVYVSTGNNGYSISPFRDTEEEARADLEALMEQFFMVAP